MTAVEQVRALVYRDGASAQVRLAGPLNIETIPFFQQRLEGVISEGCNTLALDLGGTVYLDSDGIRWLQRLSEQLSQRGVELRLSVREGSRAARTLDLLRLDGLFSISRYPAETMETGAEAGRL